MKNIVTLNLFGYTVQGTDRRDNCIFEDFIVVSSQDGEKFKDRADKIIGLYNKRGYEVCIDGVIPDDNREYEQWNKAPLGVQIELNLLELYQQHRATAE